MPRAVAKSAEVVEQNISYRRSRAQSEWNKDVAKRVARTRLLLTPAPLVAAGWLLPVHGAAMLLMAGMQAGSIVLGGFAVAQLFELSKRSKEHVFVMSEEGNDPTGAMDALDDLVASMRNPATGRSRLLASYENAVDRVQALIPDHPLSQAVAYGYFPSRPREYLGNERYKDVDFDREADADASHWERAMIAMEKLRSVLRSSRIITETEVVSAVSALVAPLRAALRARGIPTWRIERSAPSVITAGTLRDGPDDGAIQDRPLPLRLAGAPPAAHVPEEDALTPIETRMNASAQMTAMSLRSMITAFRSANPSLFMGDDRQTAETLLDDHLPRTVAAFVVSDDANVGEDRDAVRAEFARSLSFIRDSMAGIMDRHRLAARQVLETQTRFIEQRHGSGPLAL